MQLDHTFLGLQKSEGEEIESFSNVFIQNILENIYNRKIKLFTCEKYPNEFELDLQTV